MPYLVSPLTGSGFLCPLYDRRAAKQVRVGLPKIRHASTATVTRSVAVADHHYDVLR